MDWAILNTDKEAKRLLMEAIKWRRKEGSPFLGLMTNSYVNELCDYIFKKYDIEFEQYN